MTLSISYISFIFHLRHKISLEILIAKKIVGQGLILEHLEISIGIFFEISKTDV